MGGLATIQALLDIDPKARIIAISGVHQHPDIPKLREHGVYHFLPKPRSMEMLLPIIHELLHPQG
ncbi:MAG: hypothetical protein WDM76_10570 [Limisphaerales bacterium]